MRNVQEWLAESLVSLADAALQPEVGPEVYWQFLTESFGRLIDESAVWVLAPESTSRVPVVVAGDEDVRRLAELEASSDEGPGVDSVRNGDRVLDTDLSVATLRWPRFAPAARSAGYAMSHAFALSWHDTVVGAVHVVTPRTAPLSESQRRVARALTDTAAVGILQDRTIADLTETSSQLKSALQSRVVIEQAKGMVASGLGIRVDAAFEVLRDHARAHNLRLDDVAHGVVRGTAHIRDLLPEGLRRSRLPSTGRRPPRRQ